MSNIKLDAAKAARYWGCEVVCAPYTGQPNKKLTGKMIGVTTDSIYIKFPEWATSHGMFVSDCQLLLTPLSAITDEHAIEVAKVMYHEITEYNHLLNIGWGVIAVIKGDKLVPEFGYRLFIPVFDLLRSLGYDCDNAISEGWGVDRLAFVN